MCRFYWNPGSLKLLEPYGIAGLFGMEVFYNHELTPVCCFCNDALSVYKLRGYIQNKPDWSYKSHKDNKQTTVKTAHFHPATCNLAYWLTRRGSPTGASRCHNCCIDGSTSPEYFGYTLIHSRKVMKDSWGSACLKPVYFTVQLMWLEGQRTVMSVCICSCGTGFGDNYLTKQSGLFLEMLIVPKLANNFTICYTTNSSSPRMQQLASGPHP
jgi:hypothetical protein